MSSDLKWEQRMLRGGETAGMRGGGGVGGGKMQTRLCDLLIVIFLLDILKG
jgi:hypothetical protein